MRTVTTGFLRSWPLPEASGNKNTSGRVLVVGGNVGMPGAVLLAAEAAMRAGAGKLQRQADAEPSVAYTVEPHVDQPSSRPRPEHLRRPSRHTGGPRR